MACSYDRGNLMGDAVKGRANNFDLLRLLAALSVAVNHSARFLHAPFLGQGYGARLLFYDGVPVFFVISGYLVFQSAEACVAQGRPIREFFTNRFLRVAPAIYAYAVIATALLVGLGVMTFASLATPGYLAWLVSTALLFPILNPDVFRGFGVGQLNPALWTIPVEVTFYAAVPAIVILRRRLGPRWMLALLGVVALSGSLSRTVIPVASPPGLLLSYTFAGYLPWFALGIFWRLNFARLRHPGWYVLPGVAAYVVVEYGLGFNHGDTSIPWQLLAAVPLSYAVVWFAVCGPTVFNRVIARVGDLSFGVYIWHCVVINTLIWAALQVHAARILVDPTLVDLAVVLLSLVLAWLSWHLVEKRALRLKPFSSRGGQRKAGRAPGATNPGRDVPTPAT